MKLYEINNCEREAKEMFDIPFNAGAVNMDSIQCDCFDFILIEYNDEKLLSVLSSKEPLDTMFPGIESVVFFVDTAKEMSNPIIKLRAFFDDTIPGFYGIDNMITFNVQLNKDERMQAEYLMIRELCNCWYGARIYA